MDKCLIIAEAGVNHNGSLELAKKLVRTAKECGADVVKFQTAKLDALVSNYAPMAKYQEDNIGNHKTQKEMLKELLLSYDDFCYLADYCRKENISFLSTPFDIDSIHFLDSMLSVWKIPSGEITNYPYLVEIARTRKPIFLSTGMSTMYEVEAALSVLKQNGAGKVTILHCTTNYPTPMSDVNLKAMLTMREHFKCKVGYSDHTNGIEIPIAAAALGACVIEKHLTLDKEMKGPDHKASADPQEFCKMVEAVRRVESAMGTGKKEPCNSELDNIDVVRKSIIAARDIKKGEIFTEKNLTTKRPGTGINPMNWNKVLGLKAMRDFIVDELIEI